MKVSLTPLSRANRFPNGAPLLVLQGSTLPKVRTSQGASREGRGSPQPAPSLLLVVPQADFAFPGQSHFPVSFCCPCAILETI
uniref:Uncharacterized protein n=1 Tax=Calidris pygmaea TaxID=425635 RepID=A0A8C3J238_9CHAR